MLGLRRTLIDATPLPLIKLPVQVWKQDYTVANSAVQNFQRASIGWDYIAGGTLKSFAVNAPMEPVFYAGGATANGVGLMGSRTNYAKNSTAPATQTVSLTTAGTYIVWIVGSGSVMVTGTGLTTISGSAAASAGTPYVFYISASTSVVLTVSGTVTFFQLEKASSANASLAGPSSPIVTTTAAVARSPDILGLPLSAIGSPSTSGAFLVLAMIPFYAPSNQYIACVNDGTTNNQIAVYWAATTQKITISITVGGTLLAAISTGATTALGAIHRIAFGWDHKHISLSVDGTVTKTDVQAAVFNQLVLSTLNLGSAAGGANNLFGYVSYAAAWNGCVSDATLQAASSPPIAVPAGGFVYLPSYGQSNSDGAHATPPLTTSAPSTSALMLNDTWGTRGAGGDTYTTSQGAGITGFVPAFETNGPNPPISAAADYGETHVTSYMMQILSHNPGKVYIGRSSGAPGHTIAQLTPGTTPFKNMVSEITRAAGLSGAGKLIVPGLAMIEGSSDAEQGNDPTAYRNNAASIMSTLNSKIRAITGQTASILCLQMQVPQANNNSWNMNIGQAQFDLCFTSGLMNTLFLMVGPSFMFPQNPAHPPHYINTSQQWQGEYLGEAANSTFNLGVPWKPLYPKSIAQKSGDPTTWVVTVNVPFGNLTIDTTSLQQGAAPNYGLVLANDTTGTTISSVTVTGSNTFAVKFNQAPASSALLQNAYKQSVTQTAISGAWSNFRDQSTAIGAVTGFHLYNWMVSFSLALGFVSAV